MARDIEEFLRQAAQRRNQQARQQVRPPSPTSVSSQRSSEVIRDVEIVEAAPPATMKQQGVAEHVRSHINTAEIADHARHLGERIQNVDEVVADRLGAKFDHHDVSKLDDRETVIDDAIEHSLKNDSSEVQRRLIAMLSSPRTIRQAILVSEVLKRPDFED